MDTVIMPKKLTAENGAKALLMGEFHVKIPMECGMCEGTGECDYENSEPCEVCMGSGQTIENIAVPWTTIKEIYAKAVEVLSQQCVESDRPFFGCAYHGECQRPVNQCGPGICPMLPTD